MIDFSRQVAGPRHGGQRRFWYCSGSSSGRCCYRAWFESQTIGVESYKSSRQISNDSTPWGVRYEHIFTNAFTLTLQLLRGWHPQPVPQLSWGHARWARSWDPKCNQRNQCNIVPSENQRGWKIRCSSKSGVLPTACEKELVNMRERKTWVKYQSCQSYQILIFVIKNDTNRMTLVWF